MNFWNPPKNRNENFFSGKAQRISSNVSPFAGISFVNKSFNKYGLIQLIANEVGQRVKTVGFSYSEKIRNFTNVFCSGSSCAEDIQTHLACIIHKKMRKFVGYKE